MTGWLEKNSMYVKIADMRSFKEQSNDYKSHYKHETLMNICTKFAEPFALSSNNFIEYTYTGKYQ